MKREPGLYYPQMRKHCLEAIKNPIYEPVQDCFYQTVAELVRFYKNTAPKWWPRPAFVHLTVPVKWPGVDITQVIQMELPDEIIGGSSEDIVDLAGLKGFMEGWNKKQTATVYEVLPDDVHIIDYGRSYEGR